MRAIWGKLSRKTDRGKGVWRGTGAGRELKCCQLLQNACKCSIYIRNCFRIFICICCICNCICICGCILSCICDIPRTFRHISLHFLEQNVHNFGPRRERWVGGTAGYLLLLLLLLLWSCKLIELPDLRINWHSNAKIDTNWAADANAQRIQLESYLNLICSRIRSLLEAGKLYGEQQQELQPGNAFKSIDKMKCNPLAGHLSPTLSSIPFRSATM